MTPVSLSAGSGASSGPQDFFGGGFGAGAWNVNVGGSGVALQSASGSSGTAGPIPPWAIAAGVVAVAWLLLRR